MRLWRIWNNKLLRRIVRQLIKAKPIHLLKNNPKITTHPNHNSSSLTNNNNNTPTLFSPTITVQTNRSFMVKSAKIMMTKTKGTLIKASRKRLFRLLSRLILALWSWRISKRIFMTNTVRLPIWLRRRWGNIARSMRLKLQGRMCQSL